jgi:hypothetical protein
MKNKPAHVVQKSQSRWEITTVAQLNRLFDERPYLKTGLRASNGVKHLRENYAKAKGVTHLGFTFIRSLMVFTFTPYSGKSVCEMRVECQEGTISRDEALGEDWIPTPAEVWSQAAEIRKKNDQRGEIRRGEFSGFDLRAVYPSTIYID